MTVRTFVLTLAVTLISATSALAGFTIGVANQSFQQNTGVQGLVLNIQGTGTTGFVNVDVTAAPGIVFTPVATGVFGQAGQFAAGQFGAGSDISRDIALSNVSYVSLFLPVAQSLPGASTELAKVNFDTTGLAIGDYTVALSNIDGSSGPFAGVGGTISITAVPEPTSIALIGVGLALVGGVARFRRRRSSKTVVVS